MTRGLTSAPFLLDNNKPTVFPDVELALTDPDGLLAIGGDLSVERLTAAYQHGIFPWYSEGQPIIWWSPNPRAVLFLEKLKISRSLKKTLKKDTYKVTFDLAFKEVIEACAVSRRDGFGTWIVEDMKDAYINLHQHGIAHSVEVWSEDELIGGLYGVSLGKAFFGESMFSRKSDASKVALTYLVQQLKQWDFGFIDCQVYSEHLETLGSEQISRQSFIRLLNDYCGEKSDIYIHQHPWHCSVGREKLFEHE